MVIIEHLQVGRTVHLQNVKKYCFNVTKIQETVQLPACLILPENSNTNCTVLYVSLVLTTNPDLWIN